MTTNTSTSREHGFFAGLTPQQIQVLARKFTNRKEVAGTVLSHAGGIAHNAWVIVKGEVEVLSPGMHQIAILKQGEAVSLPALFHAKPRSVSLRVLKSAWLLEMDHATFQTFLDSSDPTEIMLVTHVAKQLASQLRQIDDLLARMESADRYQGAVLRKTRHMSKPAIKLQEYGITDNGTPAKQTPQQASQPKSTYRKRDDNASREDLIEWIGQMAELTGIDNLDEVRVVHSAEAPIKPNRF